MRLLLSMSYNFFKVNERLKRSVQKIKSSFESLTTHLKRTPEFTGDGVRCLDGLFLGLLAVYSLMGGNLFGKSGILFCELNKIF